MELAPKLGEATSKSTLAPLLLLFLRDEIVDVRLNILKRMEYLAQWMASFESILLPAIADLARDLQWRVREAVILSIPALAGSLVRCLLSSLLGDRCLMQQHVLTRCYVALTDSREASTSRSTCWRST